MRLEFSVEPEMMYIPELERQIQSCEALLESHPDDEEAQLRLNHLRHVLKGKRKIYDSIVEYEESRCS